MIEEKNLYQYGKKKKEIVSKIKEINTFKLQ